MRVISGSLGGRTFQSPDGHRTRPMSDKIRGAIFNILGDITGLTVLDAFAGSGALSFEAISRGAKHCTAVDRDKSAHQTITENSKALGITPQIKAIRANVSSWSDRNPDQTFDLVFCDPPYDKLQLPLVQKLSRHLKPRGLLVLSNPPSAKSPNILDTKTILAKDYGDAQITIYRKE